MFSKSFKVSYFSFNPCLGQDSGSTNPHQVFKGPQWQSQLWTRSQWDRERSRVTTEKGVTGMNNQLFSPQAKLHLEPGYEAGHGWYTLVIQHTGGKDKRIRNSRSSSATRRIRGQSGLQETLDKTKQNKSHIEWARVAICSNRLNRQDVSPVSSRKDWSWKITQVFSKCERKPYLKFMLLTHPKNQNALTALESSAWRLEGRNPQVGPYPSHGHLDWWPTPETPLLTATPAILNLMNTDICRFLHSFVNDLSHCGSSRQSKALGFVVGCEMVRLPPSKPSSSQEEKEDLWNFMVPVAKPQNNRREEKTGNEKGVCRSLHFSWECRELVTQQKKN